MRTVFLIGLALTLVACAPTAQPTGNDKSQFDVMRGGVNMDAFMVACANTPKSVGFDTTKACFDHAGTLMK